MRDWAFHMIVLTASAGATVAVLIFDDEGVTLAPTLSVTALAQPDDLDRQARAFQRKVNSIRVTVPHGREVRLHAVNDALAIPATLAIERQVAQRGLVGRKPELLDEVVIDITGAHADVGHASAPSPGNRHFGRHNNRVSV
jgi:hypothetical protein